jgi:hypothetical protein
VFSALLAFSVREEAAAPARASLGAAAALFDKPGSTPRSAAAHFVMEASRFLSTKMMKIRHAHVRAQKWHINARGKRKFPELMGNTEV